MHVGDADGLRFWVFAVNAGCCLQPWNQWTQAMEGFKLVS